MEQILNTLRKEEKIFALSFMKTKGKGEDTSRKKNKSKSTDSRKEFIPMLFIMFRKYMEINYERKGK